MVTIIVHFNPNFEFHFFHQLYRYFSSCSTSCCKSPKSKRKLESYGIFVLCKLLKIRSKSLSNTLQCIYSWSEESRKKRRIFLITIILMTISSSNKNQSPSFVCGLNCKWFVNSYDILGSCASNSNTKTMVIIWLMNLNNLWFSSLFIKDTSALVGVCSDI